jgi:hypothetical protein
MQPLLKFKFVPGIPFALNLLSADWNKIRVHADSPLRLLDDDRLHALFQSKTEDKVTAFDMLWPFLYQWDFKKRQVCIPSTDTLNQANMEHFLRHYLEHQLGTAIPDEYSVATEPPYVYILVHFNIILYY